MRIVRLANFVTPRSGGLRTALRCLGAGYRAAGHEPVLVIPGERASDEMIGPDRVITLPAPVVPGTGGYRVLVGRAPLRQLLEALGPDRLEVSDRSTLRWTGAWARAHGVPSLMVSHESLTGLLGVWGTPAPLGQRLADRLNARSAATYDQIVCTTGWAAAEFRRIGTSNLTQVPLGVDLEAFHPDRRNPEVRAEYVADGEVLLVHCSRLSPEKRPELAVDALAALRAAGVPATLVVVGDGPRRGALAQRAAGLPVHFTGFLPDRDRVAALLASADVVVAPGPVETFGLAGLEALACGTPVVVNAASALPEVVGDAGLGADGTGAAFAEAIGALLARSEPVRRAAARARAEGFGWSASVEGFLRAHDAPVRSDAPVGAYGRSGVPQGGELRPNA
ncbi:glycosyltransferase [Micromonospora pisi]|uniref:glycosyltransferase n=1 Tax=Micromonospora pisi TaxID=589240 RepID=UPI000EAE52FE|nr:glycosyltransferase [Micromonospora pisi]